VGKTTLALQLIKSAQEQGIECIWVDAEWSWDNHYAEAVGVNTKKLGLLQTRVAEDSLDELLRYVEEGKDTLIVIDAVGALHPKDEAEKESGERTIGAQSSLVARFCRKIVPMLALNNNALVVLNHEYTPIISTGGRPQLMTSGGKKLEYHKSMWIRLTKTGDQSKEGENVVGFWVEAEIRKNKLSATQKQSCEMELLYDRGFNPTTDLLRDALEKGIIERKGNTFWLGDEKLGMISAMKLKLQDASFSEKLHGLLSPQSPV
jgi:recombination protein RecA